MLFNAGSVQRILPFRALDMVFVLLSRWRSTKMEVRCLILMQICSCQLLNVYLDPRLFATSHIPRGTFVCEIKTNAVCLSDEFLPMAKEYNFNREPVFALIVKIEQDEERIYDCTRRFCQYGR